MRRGWGRDARRLGRGTLLGVLAGSLVQVGPAYGEGSVDFNTGEDSRYRNSMGMYAPDYTILRVYARAGEKLQMGSSSINRVIAFPPNFKNPSNIVVYPPGTSFASSEDPTKPAAFPGDPVFATGVFDCKAQGGPGAGLIATRAQEVAGPAPNPDGYPPCEFTVPADGIYPVLMRAPLPIGGTYSSGTVGTPAGVGNGTSSQSMWDVTVRDAQGQVRPGRLFSNRFSLVESSRRTGSARPNPRGYVLTPAGYAYEVRFFSHWGQVWQLAANDRGVVDAGTAQRTFASFQWSATDNIGDHTLAHTEAVAPHLSAPDVADDARYPIFVNPPDPIAVSGPGGLAETRGYATSPIGASGALRDLQFTGESGVRNGALEGDGGTFEFASPPAMNGLGFALEIDVDRNGTFGDATDVLHEGQTLDSSGTNRYVWDGKDAKGATPACGSYRWRVRSTLAEFHLTQNDVEESGGTQIRRLTLPDDPNLGDPLMASYNDLDPYKNTPVTNSDPTVVTDGRSGPTFHPWTADSGNGSFVDTWMRLPETAATGTFELCLVELLVPGMDPLPPAKPLPKPPNPAPTPQPTRPASKTPAPRPARLAVRKTVDRQRVRAGSTATFTIRVTNPTGQTLRNVRVCDEVPSGVVPVRSRPRARLSRGRQCWTISRLAAGRSATLRMKVRTLPGARGRKSGRVTASSQGVRSARADAGFLVVGGQVAGGGVTG